jgi:hypothetical protein
MTKSLIIHVHLHGDLVHLRHIRVTFLSPFRASRDRPISASEGFVRIHVREVEGVVIVEGAYALVSRSA